MSFYGNQFSINESSLTMEEFIELNISINENLIDIIESFENDEEKILEEGANIEATKEYVKYYKEYKLLSKEFKKKMKNDEYFEAKKVLSKMKTCVNKIEDGIRDQDYTVGSAILGLFATWLVGMVQLLIPNIITRLGDGIIKSAAPDLLFNGYTSPNISKVLIGMGTKTIGSVTLLVKSIIILVKDIKQFIEDLKDKDISTEESFNLYRNKLLTFVKDLNKKIDKIEKELNKKMKK